MEDMPKTKRAVEASAGSRRVGRPSEAERTRGDITQRAFFRDIVHEGERGLADDNPHWIWKRRMGEFEWSPTVKVDGKYVSLRKLLFREYRKVDVDRRYDLVLPDADICDRPDCVAPNHAKVYSRSDGQAMMRDMERRRYEVASSDVTSGTRASGSRSNDAADFAAGFLVRVSVGDDWEWRSGDFPQYARFSEELEEAYADWIEDGEPNTRERPLRMYATEWWESEERA